MTILRYGSVQEAGLCGERLAKLEALQQHWVAQGVTPVLISLIARKGVIVSHKMFIDPAYNSQYGPVKLDSIFPLSSISKPMTATAIMILIEEGKISANVSLQDYIPEFAGESKGKVLLHHLLTHTSGITDDKVWEFAKSTAIPADASACPANLHPEVYQYLRSGYGVPLSYFPGTQMIYCNYGFTLLAEVVRRVSGLNIHEFAAERIFKPLGMNDSYYIVPQAEYPRVVKHPAEAPFPNFSDYEKLIRPVGSSGLCSTAYDMAVFLQTFLNGGSYNGHKILSRLGVETMTANRIPGVSSKYGEEFFKEACWGYGWNVSGDKNDYTGTLRSAKTFSHSGRGNTQIMADPVNDIITVNFQVTMKRIQNRAYHYFEHFNDSALASIVD